MEKFTRLLIVFIFGTLVTLALFSVGVACIFMVINQGWPAFVPAIPFMAGIGCGTITCRPIIQGFVDGKKQQAGTSKETKPGRHKIDRKSRGTQTKLLQERTIGGGIPARSDVVEEFEQVDAEEQGEDTLADHPKHLAPLPGAVDIAAGVGADEGVDYSTAGAAGDVVDDGATTAADATDEGPDDATGVGVGQAKPRGT